MWRMDAIELGTDVLPQHLLNKTNQELTAQIAHFEQQVDQSQREADEQARRDQEVRAKAQRRKGAKAQNGCGASRAAASQLVSPGRAWNLQGDCVAGASP